MPSDPETAMAFTSGTSSLYACLRSPDAPDVAVVVAQEFSPRLQRYGRACVVVDVSGLGRLLGEPQAIGEALASAFSRDAERSPSPQPRQRSVAIAPTQMAAMLLSSAYQGLTVVTDDVAEALTPVRLEVLRQVFAEMQGITMPDDHVTDLRVPDQRSVASASRRLDQRFAADARHQRSVFEVLQRWGLTTLGDYAAIPGAGLSARLGQAGSALQRMARGVDARPLVPDADVPRFLERVELEWPIDGLEPLAFVLARLLEPLSSSLERADRAAAAIHLRLRLVDRTEHVRMLQLPAAIRDPKVLRTLLVLDLESHPPPAAIDIVTIEVDPAPGRVLQYSLLERARPSAETLATLTARLGALVGESRCGCPILLDSHGPDAFALRRFAPDDRVSAGAVFGVSRTGTGPVDFDNGTSPVLESAVLRRFRPPLAVRVAVERGRPRHLAIDRRGMPGGHVEQCAGPWRSSGAWWTAPRGELSGGPSRSWNRDEWDVALSDGSVCRLFQERGTELWFLDGVVD